MVAGVRELAKILCCQADLISDIKYHGVTTTMVSAFYGVPGKCWGASASPEPLIYSRCFSGDGVLSVQWRFLSQYALK